MFKRNYDNCIHKSVSDRTIDTATNKKINKNLWSMANGIIRNYLNVETVTLWENNCTIYCIVLTCKELNNAIRTSEKRKKELPMNESFTFQHI